MIEGYLIHYGDNGEVFTEKPSFKTVLNYLQFRNKSEKGKFEIKLIILTKLEGGENNILCLNQSSFQYLIKYTTLFSKECKEILVSEKEKDKTWKRLEKEGYKVYGAWWVCPELDKLENARYLKSISGVKIPANDMSKKLLHGYCSKLLKLDNSNKSYVEEILEMTNGDLDQITCEELIADVKYLCSQYEGKEK